MCRTNTRMPLIREGRPCQRHICSYITDTYVLISTCVIISVFLYKHTHDTHQRGAPIVLNPSTRLQVRKEGGAASFGSGGDGAKHPGLTPVSETATFPYQTHALATRMPHYQTHICPHIRHTYVPTSQTHMFLYPHTLSYQSSHITDT